MVKAAEGIEGAGLITAAGGNGHEVGLQIAGLPGKWFTAPAQAPVGDLGAHPASRALGAIGDSALVDCYGLGAMAFRNAPQQREAMAEYLPESFERLTTELPLGRHPYFADLNQGLGLSVHDMQDQSETPVISLGVIDKEGTDGRLGPGIARLPLEACKAAVRAGA